MGDEFRNLPCDDVVIQSNTPDGRLIYKRVLGGASENLPRQLFFDAQNDVVLLETSWSTDFPTTPDAVQPTYAGPPPAISAYAPPLQSGGDLFLSVLNPADDLLYSTFLGSSGSDDILGIQSASHMRVDLLVSVGAGNFPVAPADAEQLSSGLVLLRIDLNRRTVARSAYLPIGPPGAYIARFGDHGSVAVVTSGGLYTFSRGGRLRTFVSLDSFGSITRPPRQPTRREISGCSAQPRTGLSSPSWREALRKCFAGHYNHQTSFCLLRSSAPMASRTSEASNIS